MYETLMILLYNQKRHTDKALADYQYTTIGQLLFDLKNAPTSTGQERRTDILKLSLLFNVFSIHNSSRFI